MKYVFNAMVLPIDWKIKEGEVMVRLRKVSLEEARDFLSGEYISAIGHQATAALLSTLLNKEIPYNRIAVFMQPGDQGLHFVLRTRLQEGAILGEEDLKKLDFDLVLSEVLA